MNFSGRAIFFCIAFAVVLFVPVLWPRFDLVVSGLFYRSGQGFFLAENPLLVALHEVAYYGARVLGAAFALLALAAVAFRSRFLPSSKASLFLLLALIIGPGLIANAGLKDHWGRARPREVMEFGGTAPFSPALVPHFERAHSNGSFVSGDGAFGFFLPAFAYVVPRRLSRRVFGGSMLVGGIFGAVRIIMGAHFLSDVAYAALFMLASVAGVHAAMYGRQATAAQWRDWFKN
jgi:lipid A 4'-phosphatase